MKHIWNKGHRGFTLIELVVVIAILGVLAAVATPLVANYLGGAKERAWNADKAQIQAAVDAYYSGPTNTKFTGKRQYPTKAMTNAGTSAAILLSAAVAAPDTARTTLLGIANSNPVGGTAGGAPTWVDSDTADGFRATSGDVLYYSAATAAITVERWKTTTVSRAGTSYIVDSRDWFIDFDKLVTAGLLDKVPSSASTDNKPTGSTNTYSGTYSWYVDTDGKVQSLLSSFPVSTNTGYQSGVYP